MKKVKGFKTIRMKLFSVFFLSIVSLIATGILLNILFLESFYISRNKSFFIETTEEVSELYHTNEKQVEPIIENIGKHKNINIEIVDAKAKIIYSSIAKNQSGENLPNEITQVFNDNRLDIIKSYIYTTVSNDKHEESSRTLVFMQTLSKDRFIVISKQLSGITESVIIMNQFALLSGSVIILVGGILTLIISSRATKPILEMSETAEKISNLDFDNSIDVQSEDEIGVLANSINSISNKLSRSIEDLKTDIERRKKTCTRYFT